MISMWFSHKKKQLDKGCLTMGSNNNNDQCDSAWRVCIFEDKFFYLLSCKFMGNFSSFGSDSTFSFEVIYLISENALKFHRKCPYIIHLSSPTSNLIA